MVEGSYETGGEADDEKGSGAASPSDAKETEKETKESDSGKGIDSDSSLDFDNDNANDSNFAENDNDLEDNDKDLDSYSEENSQSEFYNDFLENIEGNYEEKNPFEPNPDMLENIHEEFENNNPVKPDPDMLENIQEEFENNNPFEPDPDMLENIQEEFENNNPFEPNLDFIREIEGTSRIEEVNESENNEETAEKSINEKEEGGEESSSERTEEKGHEEEGNNELENPASFLSSSLISKEKESKEQEKEKEQSDGNHEESSLSGEESEDLDVERFIEVDEKKFAELKELDSAIEQALEFDRESEKIIREEMETTEEILNNQNEKELNEVEIENDQETTESEETASESDVESELEENNEFKDKEWEDEDREFKGNAKRLEIEPVLGDTTEDIEVRESITESEREIIEENKENSRKNEQEEKEFKGNAKRLEIEPILEDSVEDKEVAETLKDKGGALDEKTKERTNSEKEKQIEKENVKKLEIPPVLENTEEDKEVVKSLKEREIQDKEKELEKEQETKGEKISYDDNYNIVREIYCELEGPIPYEEIIDKERDETKEAEKTEETQEGHNQQDFIDETIKDTKENIEADSEIIEEITEKPTDFEELLYDLDYNNDEKAELERTHPKIDNEKEIKEKTIIEEKNEQRTDATLISEVKDDSEKELEILEEDLNQRDKEREKEKEREEEEVGYLTEETAYLESKILTDNHSKTIEQKKKLIKEKNIKKNRKKEEVSDTQKNDLSEELEEETENIGIYEEIKEPLRGSLDQEDFNESEESEQQKEQDKGREERLEKEVLEDLLSEITRELRETNEKDFEEEWERILRDWIEDLKDTSISENERQELLRILSKYSFLRRMHRIRKSLIDKIIKGGATTRDLIKLNIIQDFFKEVSHVEKQLFINLKSFKDLYNKPHLREQAIVEKAKFLRHLFTKLLYFKLLYYPSAIPTGQISSIDWAQKLKKKLLNIKDLDQERKAKIHSILSKRETSKEEEKEIINILSLLSTETLIEIFGPLFAYHTKNYIRWGWDFYRSTKQLMLERFFHLSEIAYARIREINSISKLDAEMHLLKMEYEKLKEIKQEKVSIIELFSEIKNLQEDRSDLMKKFEKLTGKNAIWRNKITKNYKKWIKRELKQKIDNLQKEKLITSHLYFLKKKFKEVIKNNLYKIIGLNLKEKSQIIEIIGGERIAAKDRRHLKEFLKKLSKKELSYLMNDIPKNNLTSIVKTAETQLIESNPSNLSIEEKLHHLNKFINGLKTILGVSSQAKLSEYMGFKDRRYLTKLKVRIKKRGQVGIPRYSLSNAYYKIKRNLTFENDKLPKVKKKFEQYSKNIGYEDMRYKEPSQYLNHLEKFIEDLKKILNLQYQYQLIEYIEYDLGTLKPTIKSGLQNKIPIDSLLKVRARIRARLIIEKKNDRLDAIEKLFNEIIENCGYEKGESPLYLPLKRLQCCLIVLLHKAGITKKELNHREFNNLFGKRIQLSISRLKNDISNSLNEYEFLMALNLFEKEYKKRIGNTGLRNELINEIYVFKKILKEHGRLLIRKIFERTIRGNFLKRISKALYEFLPDHVFVPRTLFSKLLLGDESKLMVSLQRKGSESLFIGEQTIKNMEDNIQNLEYTEESIGFLVNVEDFSQNDLNQFKSSVIPIIKSFEEIGKDLYFNEEVIGFLLRKIFEGYKFEQHYRPNWMKKHKKGTSRELDFCCEDIDVKLAIEVQGPHHYDAKKVMQWLGINEERAKQLVKENEKKFEWKQEKCDDRGITLIEIRARKNDELIKLVVDLCNKKEIWAICKKKGLIAHLKAIREKYNQEENFQKVIDAIHKKALRIEEENQGINHIENWL